MYGDPAFEQRVPEEAKEEVGDIPGMVRKN